MLRANENIPEEPAARKYFVKKKTYSRFLAQSYRIENKIRNEYYIRLTGD